MFTSTRCANTTVIRTLLTQARLAATQMLRFQRDITYGCRIAAFSRRVAAFPPRVNGASRLRVHALVGGITVAYGRALKARWRPSLFKVRWQHPFSRSHHCESRRIHHTDAMGKSWPYRKMKNDHDAMGKKPRVGRYVRIEFVRHLWEGNRLVPWQDASLPGAG
jgi:hypothetical protein